MAALKLAKGSLEKASKNFRSFEFDCPCERCTETIISDEIIRMLQLMREKIGLPIHITSAYRCNDYQKELTKRGYPTAKNVSQHELGRAVDLCCEGFSGTVLEEYARAVGFSSIGVGPNWIHVDLRLNKRWTYGTERGNDGTIRDG